MQNIPYEIERKFLIKYPDTAILKKLPGAVVKEIVQTYLLCDTGSLRVRKTTCDGKTVYHKNEKRRVSDMTHEEYESKISEEEYSALLRLSDPERLPVEKTRFAVSYLGHTAEIDVYPFWKDKAILEIELENENETFEIPPFVEMIREVTGEKEFSNREIARQLKVQKSRRVYENTD